MILVDTNKIVTGSQRGSKHYKCIYLEYLDRVRKFEFSMKNFDNIRQFNVCISLLFFALYLLIISLWCLGRENNVKQFHESSFTMAKYKCTCKWWCRRPYFWPCCNEDWLWRKLRFPESTVGVDKYLAK